MYSLLKCAKITTTNAQIFSTNLPHTKFETVLNMQFPSPFDLKALYPYMSGSLAGNSVSASLSLGKWDLSNGNTAYALLERESLSSIVEFRSITESILFCNIAVLRFCNMSSCLLELSMLHLKSNTHNTCKEI